MVPLLFLSAQTSKPRKTMVSIFTKNITFSQISLMNATSLNVFSNNLINKELLL
ncbi:hypothetical protein O9A_00316 [Bartonella koehlerae C-29]|uniref:Uncharacterized protein n=1 Tax=Bartonella koehlerae C-29 TaxID=1134510 RepID=A0A067WB07_9HYPH|nr:hypothetical protein O9A_00316 [Bartonella koehlerae C-29]